MNELNVVNREVKTISSREICEIIDRRHDHILKLIRSFIVAGRIKEGQYERASYVDMQNQERIMLKLDKPSAIKVIARQYPEFVATVAKKCKEKEILL